METVKVKNVIFGEGVPKICVPIVAETKAAIVEEARSFKDIHVDVVEWRVDWFEGVEDSAQVVDVLIELGPVLNDIPLLFTFRTKKEGGNREMSAEKYQQLNRDIVASGLIDLLDVEIFIGDDIVKDLVAAAHAKGIKVVGSNHDFDKTPAKDDIIYRLRKMQDMGADIPKIAVMPQCALDVLTLLEATVVMKEQYADRPLITMSMAGQGVVSRLAGEIFGSCLTFGAAKKASAPGQIGVNDLYETLVLIHKSST